MIVFQNQDTLIASNDRIALYGDGCFTTLCVEQGQVELLDAHIARLQQACTKLNIEFEDWSELKTSLISWADELHTGGLKAVVSRGVGGRGYGTKEVQRPRCYLSSFSLPAHYPKVCQAGASVSISQLQMARQPLLAGIKHLNRLEQVLIKQQAEDLPYDDVLVTDTSGYLVESSVANLFWRINDCWYTPNLNYCGVSGVMRNYVISLMQSNGIGIEEVEVKPEALLTAKEVFLCNSLLKICPVSSIHHPTVSLSLESKEISILHWFSELQKEVKLHA